MLLDSKTGRSELLLELFKQYPDELLSVAFEAMKSDGLITKCKASITHSTSGHAGSH